MIKRPVWTVTCTFKPSCGWRVLGSCKPPWSPHYKPAVIETYWAYSTKNLIAPAQGMRVLSILSSKPLGRGQFLNPARTHLEALYGKDCKLPKRVS